MRWFGGAFWFVLVIVSGMTNFLVKQGVQNLDNQLTHVRREALDDQKTIHDLTAEWTMLNQPERLADLNNRYVHLVAVSPKQLATGPDSIPLRPVPPPADAELATAAPPPAPELPPERAPAPLPAAAPAPPASGHAPIVPISATQAARGPIQPAPAPTRPPVAPAPVAPTAIAPAPPASLDALFAQVSGRH
jgi:hypothetical protein